MIDTVAKLLTEIKNQESAKLNSYDIKHPGIIGDMYEGLTRNLLDRALPQNLNLKVVTGIIENEKGKQSNQIDIMLVSGEGKQIPHTDSFLYRIDQIIAVIEVKKNLYSQDLADSYENLISVIDVTKESDLFVPRPAIEMQLSAFNSIAGFPLPAADKLSDFPYLYQSLAGVLRIEGILPVRVCFGYNGFKSEYSLREKFMEYLAPNTMEKSKAPLRIFAPHHLPSLIVVNNYSLIKGNALPYAAKIVPELGWPFYLSYAKNPLKVLLELIFTRLTYLFGLSDEIFGDDLEVERLNPYLFGQPKQVDSDTTGWIYYYQELSKKVLENPAPDEKWQPIFVELEQFIAFNRLCSSGPINLDEPEFLEFLKTAGVDLKDYLEKILQTGLLYVEDNFLKLNTKECTCMILPDGYVVGENSSGRLTRWVDNHMKELKSNT